jgi:hypothetical protein
MIAWVLRLARRCLYLRALNASTIATRSLSTSSRPSSERLTTSNYLTATPLALEQGLQTAKAKTGCPIFVLIDHHPA